MHYNNLSKDEKIDAYLKSIDEIKSIVAGRDTSFLPYAFNGLHYSDQKAESFARKLIRYIIDRYAKYDMTFSDEMIKFYISFLKFSIIYCSMEIRRSDLIFESFIKLSKALEKPDGGKSPVDIMVDDVKKKDITQISSEDDLNILLFNYNILCEHYKNCYDEYFISNIRYSINEFLDEENLSYFVDEQSFMYAMNMLSVCKRRLKELKFRKIAEEKKDVVHD